MKRILPIILLLICSNAQAQWSNEHEISDFSKMLVSHINPYIVPDGGATEARNVRANAMFGALTKRPPMLQYGDAGSFDITSLHRYYQSDGDKYLIAAGSTLLKADSNNDRTFITIRDELSDGKRFTFVTYKDIAIACNGTNPCQKWDGKTASTANTDSTRTANVLTADLGAPFAELNTGSNLDASSWYSYKIKFYNGTTTYYTTAVSNPILTGSTVRDVTLTDIPLGPAGTTERYVYRTEGQAARADLTAATYKLVATIADNSTTTYNDAIADGALTTTWSSSGAVSLTPPIGRFVLLHKSKLWIANDPSHKSYLYWSYDFKADIFHPDDYEPVRENDGDEITGIFNQLGILVIGKTNSIMKFVTISEDSDQWQMLGPYSEVGIQAPYSAVNTPLGIIYLSKNGLYIYNGESSQLVSDVVTPELRDVLWTSREDVVGVYNSNEYSMAYTSKESGAAVNDRVIVLDLERDAYVIDDKGISAFTVFDSGTDEGGVYSGSSASDGLIYAHDSETENLVYKTKTQFADWTADDAVVYGEEDDPYIEIGWTENLGAVPLSSLTLAHASLASAILARPDTTGTLTSAITLVNAESFDKIYWNENLNSVGNVTFQIRAGANAGAVAAASWSTAFSDPSGSDISGVTGNDYAQIRANLSTTDITVTPQIIKTNNFDVKLVYNREGAVAESTVNGLWKSGLLAFGNPNRMKRIWEVEVHYEGEAGEIDVTLDDLRGEISKTFTIDLSVDPDTDPTDNYTGNDVAKVYIYRFPFDGTLPIDYYFRYTVSDTQQETWKIFKIKTRYSLEKII